MQLGSVIRERAWVLVLAGTLLLLAFDAWTRIRHHRAVAAVPGMMVTAPETDPATPTGYAFGQRQIVLPRRGTDGYHWIMQAQRMFSDGEWRPRRVDYDNAPEGRELHWGVPYRLWLASLAAADRLLSGRPAGTAVERAALLANPVLLALLLLTLVPLTARTMGGAAAALLAIGCAGSPAVRALFDAGAVDHHGLAAACALGCVVCLLPGIRPPHETAENGVSGLRARGGFIASALCGAAGMWVSAATMVPLLAGLGGGALLACVFQRHGSVGTTIPPERWRTWGIAGALGCLAAYLLEYFPSHMGWRLEVNHPLHALAWFSGGELLYRAARWSTACEAGSRTRREALAILGGLAGVLLVPLVIGTTGDRTFRVADPFLWALHHEYIAEFQGALHSTAQNSLDFAVLARWLPCLVLPVAITALWRTRRSPLLRIRLAVTLVPALVFALLSLVQVRWFGIAGILTLVPAAILVSDISWMPSRWHPRASWVVALPFLPGILGIPMFAPAKDAFSGEEVRQLAERDAAHWLRRRTGSGPLVIASGPGSTTRLIFFSGGRGLGTFYWENLPGLRTAATLFSTASEEEMARLVREHGVSHVVLFSWDGFENAFERLARGLSPEAPAPGDSVVAGILRHWRIPVWLRPLPYRPPRHPELDAQRVLVFEVVPAQRPGEALARLAQYFLEIERLEDAQQVSEALVRRASTLPELLSVAMVQWETGDRTGFHATLARIMPLLPQAGELDLEDGLRLAGILVRGEMTAAAVRDLANRIQSVDERSLRRLTPAVLAELLILADGLQLPIADPTLRDTARALLPPYLRAAL